MGIGSFLLGNTLGHEDGARRAESELNSERNRRINSEALADEHAIGYIEIAIKLKKELIAEKQKNRILHKRFLIERRERDGFMKQSYARTRAMREFVEKGVLDRNEANAAVHKWEASPEVAQEVKEETERLNPILEEEATR